MEASLFSQVDQVYVINLRRRPDRRLKLQARLRPYEGKITWIDAWNGQLPANQLEYKSVIRQLEASNIYTEDDFTKFKQWTFQPGALGCLKSHLNCILDAVENEYQTILVLEDDILIHQSINEQWAQATFTLPTDWQLAYLGKKQGPGELEWVNNKWYRANKTTWASHAWLIKSTFFEVLIGQYNKYNNSVDNMVKDLVDQYPIYVYQEDLFITTYDSDIRPILNHEHQHFDKWQWPLDKYLNDDKQQNIQQIIIWGFTPGTNQNHTHTYIHQNIYQTFKAMFPHLRVIHQDDKLIDPDQLDTWDYSLYFVSPTHGCSEHIPILDNSLYIIHIDDDPTNQGDPDDRFSQIVNDHRGLYLACRHPPFQFQPEKRMLTLPWAANLITDNNPYQIHRNMLQQFYQVPHKSLPIKPKLVYFGSVWSGNIDIIRELVIVSKEHNYNLQLIGRIAPVYYRDLKEINPDLALTPYYKYRRRDSFEEVLKNLGPVIILSIQGQEHLNDYLSCRLFSNIAHGHLGISNNPLVEKVFPDNLIVYHSEIKELLKATFNIIEDTSYKVKLQQQLLEVFFHHTYYNRITSYIDSLEKLISSRQNMIRIPKAIDGLSRQYLMVLGFQRSGSSAMMDLFGQFTNICSLPEIYQGGKVGLNSQLLNKIRKEKDLNSETTDEMIMHQKEFVDFRDEGHYSGLLNYLEQHVDQPLIAFKIFPDNVLHITNILEMACHPNFIPIILWRDLAEVYTSWKLANQTGHYANVDYKSEKITFDEKDFQPLAYMYREWYQTLINHFHQTSTKYYSFNYEQLCDNEVFTKKLEEFGLDIGLDFGNLVSNEIRPKQGSSRWQDHVNNISEMESYLANPNYQIKWKRQIKEDYTATIPIATHIEPIRNINLPYLPYQLPYGKDEPEEESEEESKETNDEVNDQENQGNDLPYVLSSWLNNLKRFLYNTFNWFLNKF